MVDPQHPLEVQAQADGVVVRQEALEAGEQVGGCRGESTRTGSEPEPPPPPETTTRPGPKGADGAQVCARSVL